MTSTTRQLAFAAALLALAGTASAHTGHGSHGFFTGLAHPLGADHLLAMLAVGLWSVFALPAGRQWLGPATFMAALLASAAIGAAGLVPPHLELAIAASVVGFGVMLVATTRPLSMHLPVPIGLALVALSSALHGAAHGAEAPVATGFAAYAAGFLATTAALHFGGVSAGLVLRRWCAAQAGPVVAGLGLACGSAGLVLMSQL